MQNELIFLGFIGGSADALPCNRLVAYEFGVMHDDRSPHCMGLSLCSCQLNILAYW